MAAVGVRAVLLTVVVVVMGAMTVHSQRVVEVEQQSRDTPQVPFLIGYYTNWGQYRPGSCSFKPPAIEPIANSLTHLHYAFAKIDTSGNVIPIEWNDCPSGAWPGCQGTKGSTMYEGVMEVVAKHPHIKPVISIGGWTWGGTNTCPTFSKMAASAAARATFVKQTVEFCHTFDWAGVSIDWEYPGDVARGCSSADTANFHSLLQELRTAITNDAQSTGRDPLLLAITAPAGLDNIPGLGVPNVAKFVDYINIMTYDYHGAWENVTGVNTPLYDEVAGDNLSINATLATYLAMDGVPASKLVLGFATYGRSWDVSGQACVDKASCGILTSAPNGAGAAGTCTRQKGTLAYYEIAELLKQSSTMSTYDATLQSPYSMAGTGNPWVGYDDARSVAAKAQIIAPHGLAGAMAWALDTDDFNNGYPLMTALASVVHGTKCPSACSNHGLCAPSNECVCDEGWAGADCSNCVCGGYPAAVCSNHGVCMQNATEHSCACTCDGYWVGADCSVKNQPSACASSSAIKPTKGYFQVSVHVTTDSPLQGWEVAFNFTSGVTLSTCWDAPTGAHVSSKGAQVIAKGPQALAKGAAVSFTCGATGTAAGPSPDVYLNGVDCSGS